MTVPVPGLPLVDTLARYAVGLPVAGAEGQLWSEQLAHLIGYQVPVIVDARLPGLNGVASSVHAAYCPTPGPLVLYIAVELTPTPGGTAPVPTTVTVSLSGALAGAAWLEPASGRSLDGSGPLTDAFGLTRESTLYEGRLDLTGVTRGTIGDLRIDVSASGGLGGLARLHIAEVPRAIFDPVSNPTTPGVDLAWPHGGGGTSNKLIDGSATASPRGFVRVLDQLDAARYKVRRHFQTLAYADASHSFVTSSATLTDALGGGLTNPSAGLASYRIRARRLYATAANACTFRIYAMTTGTGGGKAALFVDGSLAASITVPGTTGTWAPFVATFNLPTTGSQERELSFQMQGNSGDTIHSAQFAILENEA